MVIIFLFPDTEKPRVQKINLTILGIYWKFEIFHNFRSLDFRTLKKNDIIFEFLDAENHRVQKSDYFSHLLEIRNFFILVDFRLYNFEK